MVHCATLGMFASQHDLDSVNYSDCVLLCELVFVDEAAQAIEVDIYCCAWSSLQLLRRSVNSVTICVDLTPAVEHGDKLSIAGIRLNHWVLVVILREAKSDLPAIAAVEAEIAVKVMHLCGLLQVDSLIVKHDDDLVVGEGGQEGAHQESH